jgi:acetyl-CoA C-acetyltransferase
MMYDGLFCAFDQVAMGAGTEKYAASAGLAREPQDDLAAKSHERAAAAIKEGRLADEIVPVEVPQRRGDPVVVDTDEGVRPGTTVESLSGLRPAFDKAGNITAGNASQISDGGAAVIVVSKAVAERWASSRSVRSSATARCPGRTPSLLTQPSGPSSSPWRRGPLGRDVDLFELNEAFAAVGVAVDGRPRHHRRRRQRERRAPSPSATRSACRGTRIALTLMLELRRRGGGLGAAGSVRRWRPGRRPARLGPDPAA